jgi:hypothetical protein
MVREATLYVPGTVPGTTVFEERPARFALNATPSQAAFAIRRRLIDSSDSLSSAPRNFSTSFRDLTYSIEPIPPTHQAHESHSPH